MSNGKTDSNAGFSERLKRVVEGRSQREFAIAAGISPTVLGQYIKGTSEPGLANLRAIAHTAGVTVEWLATGQGSGVAEEPASYGDFVRVPRYQVAASAGHGVIVDLEERAGDLSFRRDWLLREGIYSDELCAITAVGDSMEPTIRAGDLLLVDRGPDPAHMAEGIYVIRTPVGLLVKRIQWLDEEKIRMWGDNRAYEPVVLTPGDDLDQEERFALVGRVVWIGRRV